MAATLTERIVVEKDGKRLQWDIMVSPTCIRITNLSTDEGVYIDKNEGDEVTYDSDGLMRDGAFQEECDIKMGPSQLIVGVYDYSKEDEDADEDDHEDEDEDEEYDYGYTEEDNSGYINLNIGRTYMTLNIPFIVARMCQGMIKKTFEK